MCVDNSPRDLIDLWLSLEASNEDRRFQGRIDQLAPEKLQQQLWDLFVTRDNLMRR